MVVRRLMNPLTIPADALFSPPLQWREIDLLHERAGNFVKTSPHPSPEHLFQTTRLIADELFVEVFAQVSQDPSTNLDKNVWNDKDSVI